MPTVRLRFAPLLLAAALVAPRVFAAEPDASSPPPPTPVLSDDAKVQQSLQRLDEALNNNPKLEEDLRANLDSLTAGSFQSTNPDLDQLLKQHPGVVPALKSERHFLVHRAVQRIAHRPVFKKDFADLDKFLDAHPEISAPVEKRPRLLVDQNFLVAHPALAGFFDTHPSLSTVLMENSEKRGKKK